ncbi:E3 SUMO-protein ligase KIAA1586-like isoform X2 [Dreissena polymorpha]|nr:E3 SUMO-protein ligase KIAA1586-like isoform X2 [Dreissena polymorpha]
MQLRKDMAAASKSSISKNEAAVKAALANVLFLAKEDLPNSFLPSFNNFLIYQGVSQLAALRVDAHTTYEHSASVDDFQEALSAVIEDELLTKVKTSGKFTLMMDESTDISVHQNLIMYIRCLEFDSLGNAEPVTHFFAIDSLERANAESIHRKVLDTLLKKGIDISKLCGISTDGAAVMTGNKSGVVTRLKGEVPGLLAMHCIAHRLALSCCTGADSIPYLVKVQDILNSVYKYFHYSPKNTAMLEAVQKATSSQVSKFKEMFHTRWLSFHGSCEALLQNYSSLVSVFLEEKSGKSLSLYKPISCFKFLFVLHFLSDILLPLSVLSKAFQKKDLDFADVAPLLNSTVQTIELFSQGKWAGKLSTFLSQVPDEPQTGDDGLETFEFQGHTIRDGAQQRKEAVSIAKSFSAAMIRTIHDRFVDNDDAAILTALSNIFNPTVRKDDKVSDEYLCSLGFESCREDLSLFLGYLHSLVDSGNRTIRGSRDAANIAMKKMDLYPAEAEAAGRFLLAPVSTVDCERGFSKQNIIKTCLRSKLSVSTLDKLMRISLDSRAAQDFPLDQAFKKWAGAKNRRILNH